MRKSIITALTAVSLLLAAGCGPQNRDFKREAERLIESDNAEQLPMDYDTADCEVPTSQSPGTVFACSAVGTDGARYSFITRITGTRKFVVTLESNA